MSLKSVGRFQEFLWRKSENFSVNILCKANTVKEVKESIARYGLLKQRKSVLRPVFVFWLVILLPFRYLLTL